MVEYAGPANMKRMVAWAAGGLLLLFFVVAAAAGVWLHSSLPAVDGVVKVAGLAGTVEIVRDARGIPHIRAGGTDDAYFALGFVHAQDRLWQMESMRRLGSGRLAEVVGAAALPSDRFMRVLGFHRLVGEQFRRLREPVRRALKSYAAGVNAWLKTHGGALPPEFLLLGYAPEPWRPADSLFWGKLMALDISGNWRHELLRARLARHLPAERIDELFPPYPDDGPVTAPDLGKLTRGLGLDLDLDRLAAAVPGVQGSPRGASNSWAVAGKLTISGRPVLANDPHLPFSAPVPWYLARIEAPGLDLAGATAPGVPFTILGHNRRIAWGLSSSESDLQDLFVERLDPGDSSRYLVPGGARTFRLRREVIAVAGGDDVVLAVRETRHGPVIGDILGSADGTAGGGGKVLALAATFLRDGDLTPQALFRLNRAAGWDDFVAALADFHAPHLNVVYADIEGNIGFLAPGWVPIRRHGRIPRPGWTGEADWTGFVPFRRLPRLLNPPRGRIVAANNKIVSESYPHFITDGWAPPYRARRILDLLGGGGKHSAAAAARLQLDLVSLMARHLKPMLIAFQPATERQRRVRGLIAEWNGEMSRLRPEPLIFTAWLRELNRLVYADELAGMFAAFWSLRPLFIASVLGERRQWCDDIRTAKAEDCESLLAKALDRALDDLAERFGADFADWRWGNVHQARFRHRLLDGLPLLGSLAELKIATDGGGYTINRGSGRVSDRDRPYEHIHGAGLRAVYDLGDLENSRFVIATGQSGNPLSAHYGDQLQDWRDGRSFRLGRAGSGSPETAVVLRLLPDQP